MRTLNPYLVLIALLVVIASCSVDQESTIENDSSNFIIETSGSDNTSIQTEERFYNSQALSSESVELERTTQWVSYITATTLYTNSEAREHFVNQIHSGPVATLEPSILINDILGSSIPDTDPFKATFKENYKIYLSIAMGCVVRPGGATATPPPGSIPPGTSLNSTHSNNNQLVITTPDCYDPILMASLTEEFMNTILNDHCIELYFPNGILDIEYDTITSTAHPLSALESSNTGYYRYYPVENSTLFDTSNVNVDQSYVSATDDPIIVARPKKNRRCMYSEYNFDFTDFLE